MALILPLPSSPSQDPASISDYGRALQAMSLTSKVMQWSADTWLLDLTPCLSYWCQESLPVVDTIRKRLKSLFGADWTAAWTDHPWRSVLLATYMKERSLSGLTVLPGPWGVSPLSTASKLAGDLSWETWWQCWEALGPHLEATRLGRSLLLRRQASLMKRATTRLGWRTPGQQSHLSASSLERRFGRPLGEAWRWTYGSPDIQQKPQGSEPSETKKHTNFWLGSSFPWRPYELAVLPSISRHLEHPLREWNHLSPWLLADLDRLCECPDFLPEERALLIEWHLVLEDVGENIKDKQIEIFFRYPHSLHQEKGVHKTTLLQALYAFEQHFKRDYDPTILPPVITGWSLTLKERILHPKQVTTLFGDQEVLAGSSPHLTRKTSQPLALTQLENRLAIPLRHFTLKDDWVAVDSFIETPQTDPSELQHQNSLLALGRLRPLFTYIQPFPCREDNNCYFLERTMTKWWSQPSRTSQKDFYRVVDSKSQRHLWATRDLQTGQWLAKGLFG